MHKKRVHKKMRAVHKKVVKATQKVRRAQKKYKNMRGGGGGKKKKKIINLIPFPVKARRQHFLKVKWILAGAKEDKKQTNFSEKILNEMWNILYDPKKSVSLAKRKEIRKQILENRSNSHFRW